MSNLRGSTCHTHADIPASLLNRGQPSRGRGHHILFSFSPEHTVFNWTRFHHCLPSPAQAYEQKHQPLGKVNKKTRSWNHMQEEKSQETVQKCRDVHFIVSKQPLSAKQCLKERGRWRKREIELKGRTGNRKKRGGVRGQGGQEQGEVGETKPLILKHVQHRPTPVALVSCLVPFSQPGTSLLPPEPVRLVGRGPGRTEERLLCLCPQAPSHTLSQEAPLSSQGCHSHPTDGATEAERYPICLHALGLNPKTLLSPQAQGPLGIEDTQERGQMTFPPPLGKPVRGRG